MIYKTLGNSGLRVSEMCLGAMTFGTAFQWGADENTSRQMLDKFVEAGGNFIDSANYYQRGQSEEITGRLIAPERDYWAVATKYVLTANPDDPNASGSHRKNMVQSLDKSLKRLGTDYIDLYWVHARDPYTPVEEVMRALDDMVRAGKILYIGVSDFPAWTVAKANTLAELKGWTQFAGLQIEYNLIERTVERELLPMADDFNLGVTAWSPLASGILTGKYNKQPDDNRRLDVAQFKALDDKMLKIASAVVEVAEESGISPAQAALRWLMNKSDRIIPIIGARTLSQLEDNLGAVGAVLSDEQMNRLDEVSEIDLGFPMKFLNQEHIMRLVTSQKEIRKMR